MILSKNPPSPDLGIQGLANQFCVSSVVLCPHPLNNNVIDVSGVLFATDFCSDSSNNIQVEFKYEL